MTEIDLVEFERKMRLERLAEATIRKYLETARIYTITIDKTTKDKKKQLLEAKRQLENHLINNSPSVHNIILSTYRKIVSYKLLPKEVVKGLHKVEVKPRLKSEQQLINRTELKKLINSFTCFRDKAFFACLFETQCRITEFSTASRNEIIFNPIERRYALILPDTKTGIANTVYITESQNLLTQFINERGDWSGLFWFYPHDNIPYKTVDFRSLPEEEAYTISQKIRGIFYKRLKKYQQLAGLTNKKIYPQLFRSSGSMDKIKRGIDSKIVKKIGNWSPTSTTFERSYERLGKDDIKQAIDISLGRTTKQSLPPILKTCNVCNYENSTLSARCLRCGSLLELDYSAKIDDLQRFIFEFPAVREAVLQAILAFKEQKEEKE